MNMKALLVIVMVIGILAVGCAQSSPPTGYATYSGQQAQGGQYVGGGCGVASSEPRDAMTASESVFATSA